MIHTSGGGKKRGVISVTKSEFITDGDLYIMMQLHRCSKAHFIMGSASGQMKPLLRHGLIRQLRIHFISSLAGRESFTTPT